MDMKKLFAAGLVAVLVLFAVAAVVYAGCGKCGTCGTAGKKVAKAQTKCPVMGGEINKKTFVDVEGYRVYLCCLGCAAKVKADPKKFIAKIRASGEEPERRPVVCPACGEIKGTAQCCAADAPRCGCGMIKGSAGCCRALKPAPGQKEIVLCPKCGQVKGTEACCKAGAKKCAACGLVKGSPGCCKLNKLSPKN